MGACCTSDHQSIPFTASREEKLIAKEEAKLGYYHFDVAKFLKMIKENHTENLISCNQLNTIGYECKLNMQDIDTIDCKVFNFYKHLRSHNKFELGGIAALAIIQSKGDIDAKLEAMWEHCPGVSNGTVSEEGVRELLTLLFDIASVWTPDLAVFEQPTLEEGMTQEEVDIYKEKAAGVRDVVFQRFMTTLMSTNQRLSKQDFVSRIKNDINLSKVTCSVGIRMSLEKEVEIQERMAKGGVPK